MVWGTEKVSSLTFAGTQNNNMSDGGAKVLAQDIAGMEVIEYAKKAEMSFFDFDAVLGYFVGKMTEIKNIRLAAAGNLGREPQEEIKERLRDSYV